MLISQLGEGAGSLHKVDTALIEQLLHRNVQRFRGGLAFKAQRLLYHSTLGLNSSWVEAILVLIGQLGEGAGSLIKVRRARI